MAEYPHPFYPGYGFVYPQTKSLADQWNELPGWIKAIVTIAAVVLLTVLFAPGVPALAVTLAGGVVLGTAFVIYKVATGTTDPGALFEAFAEGFALGTLAVDVAIVAYRGIVWVGKALASVVKRGATAFARQAERLAFGVATVRRPMFFAHGAGTGEDLNALARSFRAVDRNGYRAIFPPRTVRHMLEGGHFDDIMRTFRLNKYSEVFDKIKTAIVNAEPFMEGGMKTYVWGGLKVWVNPIRRGWGLVWSAFTP